MWDVRLDDRFLVSFDSKPVALVVGQEVLIGSGSESLRSGEGSARSLPCAEDYVGSLHEETKALVDMLC